MIVGLKNLASRPWLRKSVVWKAAAGIAALFVLSTLSCAWFGTFCLAPVHRQRPTKTTSSSSSSISSTLHKSSSKIEWLHIPKTGTSFGNALVQWACPELPSKIWVSHVRASNVPKTCLARFRVENIRPKWPIGDHLSLKGRTDGELRNVFTMIRSPRSRLVSGYYFVQKFLYDKEKRDVSVKKICRYARKSKYAHVALGSQAKIIAGEVMHTIAPLAAEFEAAGAPSMAVARRACSRMKKLAFVGISDFWEASMCFFHAKHGGTLQAHELVNVRPGSYGKGEEGLACGDCFDAADELLYSCAVELFEEYSEQYPQCVQYIRLPGGYRWTTPLEALRSLGCNSVDD